MDAPGRQGDASVADAREAWATLYNRSLASVLGAALLPLAAAGLATNLWTYATAFARELEPAP